MPMMRYFLVDCIDCLYSLIIQTIDAEEEYEIGPNTNKIKNIVTIKSKNLETRLFSGKVALERVEELTFLLWSLNNQWKHSRKTRQ